MVYTCSAMFTQASEMGAKTMPSVNDIIAIDYRGWRYAVVVKIEGNTISTKYMTKELGVSRKPVDFHSDKWRPVTDCEMKVSIASEGSTKTGTIVSFDPDTRTVKIKVGDEEEEDVQLNEELMGVLTTHKATGKRAREDDEGDEDATSRQRTGDGPEVTEEQEAGADKRNPNLAPPDPPIDQETCLLPYDQEADILMGEMETAVNEAGAKIVSVILETTGDKEEEEDTETQHNIDMARAGSARPASETVTAILEPAGEEEEEEKGEDAAAAAAAAAAADDDDEKKEEEGIDDADEDEDEEEEDIAQAEKEKKTAFVGLINLKNEKQIYDIGGVRIIEACARIGKPIRKEIEIKPNIKELGVQLKAYIKEKKAQKAKGDWDNPALLDLLRTPPKKLIEPIKQEMQLDSDLSKVRACSRGPVSIRGEMPSLSLRRDLTPPPDSTFLEPMHPPRTLLICNTGRHRADQRRGSVHRGQIPDADQGHDRSHGVSARGQRVEGGRQLYPPQRYQDPRSLRGAPQEGPAALPRVDCHARLGQGQGRQDHHGPKFARQGVHPDA
jgi:hypothetical protein